MGTNYYARYNCCNHCNRYDEVHIGKASGGWQFLFHATKEIKSYTAWLDFLSNEGTYIYDEYGRRHTLDQFKFMINELMSCDHNHAREIPDPRSFLDKEGHSMTLGDFS